MAPDLGKTNTSRPTGSEINFITLNQIKFNFLGKTVDMVTQCNKRLRHVVEFSYS